MQKLQVEDKLKVEEKIKKENGRQMADVNTFDLNKLPCEEGESQFNKEIQKHDFNTKVVHDFDLNRCFVEEGVLHPNKEMQDVIVDMLQIYVPKYFEP